MSVVCCQPIQNIFSGFYNQELNMRCPGNVPTLDGNEEVLFEMLIRDGFYSKPPPARPQARSFKKPEPKLSARYLSSNGYSGGQVIVPEVPVLKPEATWPNLLRKKKEVRKTQVFPPTMAVKERPLSIDPMKDYSKPLSVDCSVEYDLPKNIKPPEGADPILKIASPLRPKTPLPTATWFLQPVNNHFFLQSEDQLYLVPVEPIQLVTVPEEQYVDTVILSSGVQTPVVSNDSGRGTDGCRSPMEFLTPEGSRWLYQTDMCTSPEPVATVSDHLLLGHIDPAGCDRKEVTGSFPFLPSYRNFENRQNLLVHQKPHNPRKPQGVSNQKNRASSHRHFDLFNFERSNTHISNPAIWNIGHNPIIYV